MPEYTIHEAQGWIHVYIDDVRQEWGEEAGGKLGDLLAEKDRIIAALRAELLSTMIYSHEGGWMYSAEDVDEIIEQARSGK